jgi:hypothetical protein
LCAGQISHASGVGLKRHVFTHSQGALPHPEREDLPDLSGAPWLLAELLLERFGLERERRADLVAPLEKTEREDDRASSRE